MFSFPQSGCTSQRFLSAKRLHIVDVHALWVAHLMHIFDVQMLAKRKPFYSQIKDMHTMCYR
jgi:hypothetical protein